ncbi:MAG: THUMP domain-containing protein [Bacteroidota bacterium]|nr:THUMP domain-containing protein [Bacteroidota bacterium]
MENKNYQMIAKTQLGLETALADELSKLGAANVEILNRAVSFHGDLGFMYKANLNLRTALKILVPIHKFSAKKEDEIYRHISQIDWSSYFGIEDTFSIDAVIYSDYFNHSHYIALKAKDAIVDYFRDLTRVKRPTIDTKSPDVKINLHISNEKCTLSLDSSGDSLHKRGYRSAVEQAPISEVLAAGLILLSDWDKESDFLDPMCGSGTILIEAAMIACNIPPAIHRKRFGFMNWSNFDNDMWQKIKTASLKKTIDFKGQILGCDRSFRSVRKAQQNIKDAMLDEFISVKRANFFKNPELLPNGGTLLFNPPYGEKLAINADEFYSQIGDALKKHFSNCTAWFITSEMAGIKRVGLRHTKKIKLFNGKLECRFLKYELYSGSKKSQHN